MSKANKNAFIDLHGLKTKEALEAFTNYYNKRVQRGQKSPIEVLHGYGSHGVGGEAIKKRLRGLLKRYPEHASFESGRVKGGMYDDRTIVYPKKPLPSQEEGLAGEILAFCTIKKSEEKVLNKFRSHGDPQVRAVIKRLVRSGQLKEQRGRLKFYKTP
jgi:hypothetical protein